MNIAQSGALQSRERWFLPHSGISLPSWKMRIWFVTETQEIEKILTDRITEQYTMTQIDRITINDDLGTEADGDDIALVYLTWNQKNTGKTSKKMLEMYSSDLAATLGEQNSSVNEIAIFWTVPYLNDTAKCSYQRNGDGFVEMDMAWGKAFP